MDQQEFNSLELNSIDSNQIIIIKKCHFKILKYLILKSALGHLNKKWPLEKVIKMQ